MRAAPPSALFVLSALLAGAGNAAALDVTGTWKLVGGSRATFMQSGATLTVGAFSTTLNGTIDPDGTFQVTGASPGCSNFAMVGHVLGETRMVGRYDRWTVSAPHPRAGTDQRDALRVRRPERRRR
jgi:hypothetical protein